MLEETFVMSTEDLNEYRTLEMVLNGHLTQEQAARQLNCTDRTIRRKLKRYKALGISGLKHALRGRQSNHQSSRSFKSQVIEFVRGQVFHDCGPKYLTDKINKKFDSKLKPEVLRRWMIQEGLWESKKRKIKKVHTQRERMERFGMMIQVDGSYHDWFEGRDDKCCLMAVIDDATSKILGLYFCDHESVFNYMKLFKDYFHKYGLPMAVYSDRHSCFKVNNKKKPSIPRNTQIQTMLEILGVELIHAYSPEAKGRVERLFRTLQDRLIKDMRLENISSIQEGNAFLDTYIQEHNEMYAVEAELEGDAHVLVNWSEHDDLIFTYKQERVVSKDLVVRYSSKFFQLEVSQRARRLVGQKVTVCEFESGEVIILHGTEILPHSLLKKASHSKSVVDGKGIHSAVVKRSSSWKPGKSHPWRTIKIRRNLYRNKDI